MRKINLQLFAAETNLTTTADLEPAISIDHTSKIKANIDTLREILGITEMQPMAAGTQIKIYKMSKENAPEQVGEGEVIPLTKVTRKLGATDYYFPMYEIIIENVNIKSLTPLFEVVPQDSGWQDISFDSYFQAYSSGQKPQYRKIGKVVEIRGAFKSTRELSLNNVSTSYVLGSIPREFAPSQQIIQICQGSGEAVWTFTLRTDGTMSVSRYRKGTTWTNITTDTWLPVQVMYFVD